MPDKHPMGVVAAFVESRMEVVAAVDDGHAAQGAVLAYSNLISEAIDNRGYGHSLFRVSPSILRRSGALIFVLTDRNGEMRCALHVAADPSHQFYWINGLVKVPGQPSRFVRELLARVVVYMTRAEGESLKLKACYRLFPSDFKDQYGVLRKHNEGSARLFEDFDFIDESIEEVEIKGTLQDAHLVLYAEKGGGTFNVMIVESTESTLMMAEELLKNLPPRGGSA